MIDLYSKPSSDIKHKYALHLLTPLKLIDMCILQHSPIKAPIKSTVQAQEKRRIKFPGRKLVKPKCTPEGKQEKQSSVCQIL